MASLPDNLLADLSFDIPEELIDSLFENMNGAMVFSSPPTELGLATACLLSPIPTQPSEACSSLGEFFVANQRDYFSAAPVDHGLFAIHGC